MDDKGQNISPDETFRQTRDSDHGKVFSSNATNYTTQGHINRSSEKGRAQENKDVGDYIRSHGGRIIMCHGATYVSDDLNWIALAFKYPSNFGANFLIGAHIQKPPIVKAMQNHVLVLNNFQE